MCEAREKGNDLSRPCGEPFYEGEGFGAEDHFVDVDKMEARRGAVILIRRGDPEISGAIAEGMAKGMGNDLSRPFGAPFHGPAGPISLETAHRAVSRALDAPEGEGFGDRPEGDRPEGEGIGDRLTGEQIEVVEAEIDRQRIVAGLLRVATRNTKTQEDYDMLMIRARCEIQRYERPAGPLRRLGRRILGLYGLLCYGISLAYRQQDRILGSR